MNVVCKCLGGSHAYGLNTPESDTDIRGVYLNENIRHILKLDSQIHQTTVNDEEDTQYYELRRFVELLRKGNTGALEVLFNKNWMEVSESFNDLFSKHAMRFVDSKMLFSCLRGYGQSEHRLALGLRPGIIGHKRAEQVKKYGYSPKNFTQLIRLMYVGIHFFTEDRFIVDCRDFPQDRFELLMQLKTQPGTYTAEWATSLYKRLDEELATAFQKRTQTFKFDEEYAVDVMLKLYYPAIKQAYEIF